MVGFEPLILLLVQYLIGKKPRIPRGALKTITYSVKVVRVPLNWCERLVECKGLICVWGVLQKDMQKMLMEQLRRWEEQVHFIPARFSFLRLTLGEPR